MPLRASRPCKHPGCRTPRVREESFCEKHRTSIAAVRPYDAWRGSSASRGYDADWRRVRKLALERDRHLCQHCLARGRAIRATDVHHIVAIAVNPLLRLVLSNLLSLCHECHSSITATRDSTFAQKRT